MSLVYPDIPGNPNKKNPGVCRLSVNSLISGNKKLEENITLTEIAQRTAGFSGADLENLMNEPLCRTHEFFLHLTRSVVRFFFAGVILWRIREYQGPGSREFHSPVLDALVWVTTCCTVLVQEIGNLSRGIHKSTIYRILDSQELNNSRV